MTYQVSLYDREIAEVIFFFKNKPKLHGCLFIETCPFHKHKTWLLEGNVYKCPLQARHQLGKLLSSGTTVVRGLGGCAHSVGFWGKCHKAEIPLPSLPEPMRERGVNTEADTQKWNLKSVFV